MVGFAVVERVMAVCVIQFHHVELKFWIFLLTSVLSNNERTMENDPISFVVFHNACCYLPFFSVLGMQFCSSPRFTELSN